MKWSRVVQIVRKEVLVTLREPRMRVLLFVPPLLQLIVFGYAVNLDVENSRIAFLDQDRTPRSRSLAAEFEGSKYFRITHRPDSQERLDDLLAQGTVIGAIQVEPGFARDVDSGGTGRVQVLIDGSDSNTASIVAGYINRVISRFADRVQQQRRAAAGLPARFPALSVRSRVWFNPNLRSQDYYVPGVVVNIIGLVTVMLTAMAVVREKEIGTMEQLMVTPIRPLELMLGKTVPFAAVGLLEMMLVSLAALLIFDIPLRGNPLILLSSSLLFVLTTLGAGLLISTVSSTQQQAMMGSFFFFLPAFLLSGFAFPIRNMPQAIQYLTCLNPMRYFMEIVRGVFLKGTGVAVLWPQMTALLVIGAALIIASAIRFQKRLD